MTFLKAHLPNSLKSSLAYGLGLGLGIIITGLLYAMVDLSKLGLRIPPEFLIVGLGIAVLIEAIGSGVGGAIGGLSLPLPPQKQKSQWGKAWRSGLSMGLIFSTVLFLVILTLFLLTFYARYDLDTSKLSFVFAFSGAVFGGLFGWLLGMLLVRKHGVWQVALAGLVGFGIGGFGLGEGLYRYLLTIDSANLESGNRFWLVAAFLVFGLFGGAALGFVFSYLSEKPVKYKESKWWHWAIGGAVVLFFAAAMRPIFTAAVEMLTPNDADLASVFDSSTIGTHWMDSASLSDSMTLSGIPQEALMRTKRGNWLWPGPKVKGTALIFIGYLVNGRMKDLSGVLRSMFPTVPAAPTVPRSSSTAAAQLISPGRKPGRFNTADVWEIVVQLPW